MTDIIKKTIFILACTLILSGCNGTTSKDEASSDF